MIKVDELVPILRQHRLHELFSRLADGLSSDCRLWVAGWPVPWVAWPQDSLLSVRMCGLLPNVVEEEDRVLWETRTLSSATWPSKGECAEDLACAERKRLAQGPAGEGEYGARDEPEWQSGSFREGV